MLGAGQAQKYNIAGADYLRHGHGDRGTFFTQPSQRLRREVERDNGCAALPHEVAADRLAHYAEPDEADGPVRCHPFARANLFDE
jgi:hypothetical protein